MDFIGGRFGGCSSAVYCRYQGTYHSRYCVCSVGAACVQWVQSASQCFAIRLKTRTLMIIIIIVIIMILMSLFLIVRVLQMSLPPSPHPPPFTYPPSPRGPRINEMFSPRASGSSTRQKQKLAFYKGTTTCKISIRVYWSPSRSRRRPQPLLVCCRTTYCPPPSGRVRTKADPKL